MWLLKSSLPGRILPPASRAVNVKKLAKRLQFHYGAAMSPSPNATATLFICSICGQTARDELGNKLPNPAAAQLAEQTAALLQNSGVQVVLTRCMSVCDSPITWALASPGRHTFTFAPASTPDELAATARAYLAKAPGEKLGKGAMPPAVAATLLSRVPPLPEN